MKWQIEVTTENGEKLPEELIGITKPLIEFPKTAFFQVHSLALPFAVTWLLLTCLQRPSLPLVLRSRKSLIKTHCIILILADGNHVTVNTCVRVALLPGSAVALTFSATTANVMSSSLTVSHARSSITTFLYSELSSMVGRHGKDWSRGWRPTE